MLTSEPARPRRRLALAITVLAALVACGDAAGFQPEPSPTAPTAPEPAPSPSETATLEPSPTPSLATEGRECSPYERTRRKVTPPEGVSVIARTSKSTYRLGEEVRITVELRNDSEEIVRVAVGAPQGDFFIAREGQVVWHA